MSQPAQRKIWILPSLADLVFLAILATAILGGSRMISGDGDPGRHITVGNYILDSRSIPNSDIFSYSMAGREFVPYEWLAEVLTALSYQIAGPAGPVLLHGKVIAATFGVMMIHMRLRGSGPLMGVVVTLFAVIVSTVHWLARPHIFSFLGTAIIWAVLDLWRQGRLSNRWLWAMPPTMLLWSNLHGGFLVGLILMAVFIGVDVLGLFTEDAAAARRRLRALVPAVVVGVVACMVTPAGGSLLSHTTGYLGKKLLVDRTLEYMSPNFHESTSWLFLLMLLGTIAAVAWSARRPTFHEGILLVVFTAFALYAARNIELFAIVIAPILASQLEALPAVGGPIAASVRGWLAERSRRTARMEALLGGHVWPIVALVVMTGLAISAWRGGEDPLGVRFDPKSQPVVAVEYLRRNPLAGNMFNELGWGGYILHTMWPGQRVFIDGQTDFYGEPLVREYLQVVELRDDWRGVLDKYQVRWVLYGTDSTLVKTLTATPGWQVVHVDPLATILVRT